MHSPKAYLQNFKKYEQEVERDMSREENQIQKIRELAKERNKNRVQRQRKEPAAKRRKTSNETFMGVLEQPMQPTQRQEQQEKRKPEEHSHHSDAPPAKRKAERSHQNIKEIFRKMNSKNGQEEEAQEQKTGQEQQAQGLTPSDKIPEV